MNFSSRPDPKKLNEVLQRGSLGNILQKAKLLETFNMALTRHLPSNIATHCQIMNFNNSILVIGVDDASWLTRLRFEEQTLLDNLQADPKVPNLLGIDYKIYY
jgi:hypothetical protein